MALNDAQSSQLLAGFLVDTDNHSRSFRIEASRRLGDSWKAELEVQPFTDIDESDPLISFADDDYLLLDLAWYF